MKRRNMKMKCLKHKYKYFESGEQICVKCGKHKPLPFFPFGYAVLKLRLSYWLWKKRGLKICPKHGFYSQSWINGVCKECQKELKGGENDLER